MAGMPAQRSHGASAVLANCAWTIGGLDATGTPVGTVEKMCNTTPPIVWTPGTTLPQALYNFAGAGMISGKIYLAGGVDGAGNYSNTLWIYDNATSSWSAGPEPLPEAIGCGAAAVSAGKLYVFGLRPPVSGNTVDCSSNTDARFYVYNPSLASPPRWQALPVPPRSHSAGAVGIVGSKLYLMGGYASPGPAAEGIVDVFDLNTQTWLTSGLPPAMPTPRIGLGVAVAGSRLYTLGGYNPTLWYNGSNRVETYDPATDAWAELRPLADYHTFPFAIGATPYVLAAGGGWFTAETATSELRQLPTTGSPCDVFEPDGTGALANPWRIVDANNGSLIGKRVTEGRLCTANDWDYFLINAHNLVGGLKVRLQPPPGKDYRLDLMDSTGTVTIASSALPGFVPETLSVAWLTPATYMLRVRSQNTGFDATNRYELEILPPPPPPVATVTVTPDTLKVVPGFASALTATARDPIGNVITGRPAVWTSSAPAIATVNPTGLVTPLAIGTATISVTIEGVTATATVVVSDGGIALPTGGTIVSLTGAVRVDVPSGAVTVPTAIRIVPVPALPPDTLLYVAGTSYRLEATGPVAQPLRLTMSYAALTLKPWVMPTELELHMGDSLGSTRLPAISVDPVLRLVSGDAALPGLFSMYSAMPKLRERAAARGRFMGTVTGILNLADSNYTRIVEEQFSSNVAENSFKWAGIHPDSNVWDWAPADSLVAFALANGQQINAQSLVRTDKQLPDYIVNGSWTRTTLLAELKKHIDSVVTRYRGKVTSWVVVNEPIDTNNVSLRPGIFTQVIGPDYIDSSFVWAHRADPNAKLYLNDFNIHIAGTKTTTMLSLALGMRAAGIRVDGIGVQAHLNLQAPSSSQLAANLQTFASNGFDVRYSELDVRIPDTDPISSFVTQANVYYTVVDACLSVARCLGIVVWGVYDGDSFVPIRFPGTGRALMFDTAFKPKPAFFSVAERLLKP